MYEYRYNNIYIRILFFVGLFTQSERYSIIKYEFFDQFFIDSLLVRISRSFIIYGSFCFYN